MPPRVLARLAAVAAVLAVVSFGRIPGEGRWAADLANFAHGPAFAVVTLAVIGMLPHAGAACADVVRQIVAAIFVAMLLGAMVELLQLATGRDAAWDDLGRDALGSLAAAGFYAASDYGSRAMHAGVPRRMAASVLAVVCTVLLIAPLALTAAAYVERELRFPILVDFGSPLSTRFLTASPDVVQRRTTLPYDLAEGARRVTALELRLRTAERGGFVVWEPEPDWRGYRVLKLDVANPTDERLVLRVRIRDPHPRRERKQRDVGTFEIAPHARETATIALPTTSPDGGGLPFDLGNVRAVAVLGTADNGATTFYVARLWLE